VTRRRPGTLVCEDCGGELSVSSGATECACGGLIEQRLNLAGLAKGGLQRLFEGRLRSGDRGTQGSGVWRYRELVLPGVAASRFVTHPEGGTRLYRRDAIGRYAGVADLALKHEGENPTGSFKDRGMTVAVTQAVLSGATAVACASTGNTSASMASYAAQAGLPALVFVPAGRIAAGKLAQALAYGARTLLVRGDFDACLRLVREASRELGVTLLNSINPWRLEGQKTIVLEMLQQRGWEPPDWLVVPAGNLGNTSAFGKALLEARSLGLIRRLPRIAAIQAAGASPFHRSFRVGFRRRYSVRAETVATAIRIGDPASFKRAVRAIVETRGVVARVTDREILEAKAVVDASGLGCEPASAATVAGIRKLRGLGVIQPGDSVVGILTGHVLKDPEAVVKFHSGPGRGANRPVEIEPDLRAVERLVRAGSQHA
jgi:threonine synthase